MQIQAEINNCRALIVQKVSIEHLSFQQEQKKHEYFKFRFRIRTFLSYR